MSFGVRHHTQKFLCVFKYTSSSTLTVQSDTSSNISAILASFLFESALIKFLFFTSSAVLIILSEVVLYNSTRLE